jgi:hypothetical protein
LRLLLLLRHLRLGGCHDPEIMLGVLEITFGGDSVAAGLCVSR